MKMPPSASTMIALVFVPCDPFSASRACTSRAVRITVDEVF